jgi:hypothetical protein
MHSVPLAINHLNGRFLLSEEYLTTTKVWGNVSKISILKYVDTPYLVKLEPPQVFRCGKNIAA